MSLISGFGLDDLTNDLSNVPDIFELVKKNNISIEVKYVPVLDSYTVIIHDDWGEMHNILDGVMLDSKPDFREHALEHVIEKYLIRRR